MNNVNHLVYEISTLIAQAEEEEIANEVGNRVYEISYILNQYKENKEE